MTLMPNETRRGFLGLIAAGAALAAMPGRALALDGGGAVAVIQRAVDAVFAIINSGHAPTQMYAEFEGVFARYADVDAIARSTLGPAARTADPAQYAVYRKAMQGYIGRKYGKRFREFIGGKVEITGARPLKSFWAVSSVCHLNGRAPMQVEWHVSDKSGQPRFFNLIIEGVNLLGTEREEIQARLSRSRGDLTALAADLSRSG